MHSTADFLVVGGGIVGLATAWQLSKQFPDCRLVLLEKESSLAAHQSGRNSGVIHSGIYYKPHSLKATTCRVGRKMLEEFCQEFNIRHEICGKVIVAVDETEQPRLQGILARGRENEIPCELLDRQQLHELEPHVTGVQGIHVPVTGIVDYPAVCQRLSELLRAAGHDVCLGQKVQRISHSSPSIGIHTNAGSFECGYLVTCGGLYSDRLARMAGLRPPAKVVPFRGEYFELVESRRNLCTNLIYPVPDPKFPFLGVHFTRMVSGDVECGPNAVFALSREGYSWANIRLGDLGESLTYRGFRKLALAHWRMGMGEIHRSLSKNAFVSALQRLIPEIRSQDLVRCRAGVRAQALTPEGKLVDDFLWVTGERMLHVCNAPSPAATASLEIGRLIAEKVADEVAPSARGDA